ncbi:MAG TPA: NfeD family protein, partial [Elusimicrobiota bacterium]|nr:NfeD family protein [Elusimicrobiota bacterium]
FFAFVVAKLIQARRLKPAVGAQALIGRAGEAREPLDPEGLVFVDGELWLASAPRRLEKGARVKVLEVRGNVLRVDALEEERHA